MADVCPTEQALTAVEPRCDYCKHKDVPMPETLGADYHQWSEQDFRRGWRWDADTNTKTYHCKLAFYGAQ